MEEAFPVACGRGSSPPPEGCTALSGWKIPLSLSLPSLLPYYLLLRRKTF